jgi:hypothetical protein
MSQEIISLGKRLQKDSKNTFLRHTYSIHVKQYNRLKKSLKSAFYKTFIDKINTLDHKEGKSFWNSINSIKNNNNKYPSPISMGEWVDYYKSLLNTNLEGNTHSDLENTKENFCFYFGPNQLESCTEYKYLGVIFNNKGKLNNSAENLSEKACKAYFSLKSKIPYSNFISVVKWIKLFDSLITPIMTYG